MKRQSVRLARPAKSANGLLRACADDGALEVEIEPDPLTGTRQWFHFRAQAPDGMPIRMVDAGTSSFPRGWETANVWARAPGKSWYALQPEYDDGILTFPHGGDESMIVYALFPTYPINRLAGIAERTRACPDGEVVAADSALRRAPRLSLGDPDPAARQIWVVCAQHGGEQPSLWFADGFIAGLLSMRTRVASGKRFHVVPLANPTGMFAGHLRTTDAGQDPNRHWSDGDAQSCPEVATLLDAMTATGVDFLLDVHTDFEMDHVYLDVLDEWMGTPDELVSARERFESGLAARSPDVAFGSRFPWQSPPTPELLAAMCAPSVERRFGAATVTLEMPVGRYRNAAGVEGDWTPEHARALGRAAATALVNDL